MSVGKEEAGLHKKHEEALYRIFLLCIFYTVFEKMDYI